MSLFKVDCSGGGGNPPCTLPQSSAILTKVGCKNLQFAKVDCNPAQDGGQKSAQTRVTSHPAGR
jgi:hypothetical protein